MSYKALTKESYQSTADEFARNVQDLVPTESIEKFAKLLPAQGKIVDIGCGPGRDAKVFSEKGFSVLGVDYSQNMLDLAKANAPLADFQLMDIETAAFSEASFDGVWACCSLLHIQKKNLPAVLEHIHTALKQNGHFYLALKKGMGEVLENDLRYGEHPKFWAYYEEDEIAKLVRDAKFKVLEIATVEPTTTYQTHPGIRIICQKS